MPSSRSFLIAAGRLAIRPMLGAIRWTAKIDLRGVEHLEAAVASGRPYIFAGWHGHILPFLLWRMSVQVPHLVTMISRSRDGEMIARLAEPLGVEAIRASSSRGGAEGALEFIRRLGERDAVGEATVGIHFVDGPRGPRHVSKPGLLMIAQKANALIIPVCCGISRRIALRSWDRHCIPLPFSRIVCEFGEPIDLATKAVVYDSEDASAPGDSAPGEGSGETFSSADLDRVLRDLSRCDPLCARDYDLPDRPRKPKRPAGEAPVAAP